MLELRIRACHVHGRFIAKRQRAAGLHAAATRWRTRARDVNRIVLPPASYLHEQEKIEKRWPAAVKFIEEHRLNEFFDGDARRHRHRHAGRHVQHRAARAASCSASPTSFGDIARAALRAERHLSADRRRGRRASARGKRAVLMVEEGQPEFIEQDAQHDPAPAPTSQTAHRRQGHAADGRRIHRRRGAATACARSCASYRAELLDATRRRSPTAPMRLADGAARRSPSNVHRAPARRSAPAARSGRSSPR